MPEPAEAMQMPLSWAVSIRVTWEAVCSYGRGNCWQAALIPHAGRGNGGGMLTEGWQDPKQPASRVPRETCPMYLETDRFLQGGWRERKQPICLARSPERASDLGWAAAGEVVALGIQKYTKCFLVCWVLDLPRWRRKAQMPPKHRSVLVLWGGWASDNHGVGNLMEAFHHGDASQQSQLPLGVFPQGRSTGAKPHQHHHTPALPTALVGGKEPPEHLASGQGWFSLVPFICSRSSGVTDGSIYCIVVASPASFALIQAQQRRTIPPIHKTPGFLLFPLTFGFWMILIYAYERLSDLVKNNMVAWGQGQEAKPFFFSLQFSPKLCVNYVLQLMMKCWGCRDILLTQQKEQSTSFSKKQYFFVSERPIAPAKHWGFEVGVQGKVKCMRQ